MSMDLGDLGTLGGPVKMPDVQNVEMVQSLNKRRQKDVKIPKLKPFKHAKILAL